MTSSAPESPVYLSPPTSPLTRQIAVPSEEGFMNTRAIYWNRRDNPPLYSEATQYEPCAMPTYTDALIALTSAWETKRDLQLCVRKPRGYTFQIFFGEPTAVAPSIDSVGIDSDTALAYVACDYIRHRYAGDNLGISECVRSRHWMCIYTEALKRAGELHMQILSQMMYEKIEGACRS